LSLKLTNTSVDMATLEVQIEKVSTVDAVLELSSDELRQQLDLYGVDTKGLVSKPQLQKALIKIIQPSLKD